MPPTEDGQRNRTPPPPLSAYTQLFELAATTLSFTVEEPRRAIMQLRANGSRCSSCKAIYSRNCKVTIEWSMSSLYPKKQLLPVKTYKNYLNNYIKNSGIEIESNLNLIVIFILLL